MELIEKIRNKIFNKTNDIHINVKNSVDEKILKSKSNYSKEILEIHYEFEIAAEKLVKEAQEIINNIPTISVDKHKLLKQVGFNNVSEVKELESNIEKKKMNQELIDLVRYYSINYPSNKFITEQQVEQICKKYNLVFGDVDRYKGFVPEKNLKEIVNFKLKENESNSMIIEAFKNGTSLGQFCGNDLEIRRKNDYFHIFEKNCNEYSFQQSNSLAITNGEFYGVDYQNFFGLKDYGHINIRVVNKNLKICAPISDMDTQGMRLNGYKLEKHIPDPVVLQPVKGGYLIITAWGDEASDPLVVNPVMN